MGHPASQLAGLGTDFYRWIIQILSPRSGYRRLRTQTSMKKRVRIVKLGKKRSLKLKRLPKLRVRWVSPLVLLAKLRDAYVNLMLAASSRMTCADAAMAMGNLGILSDHRMRAPFGAIPAKEYEKEVLMELYRSMAQNQLILSLA